MTSTALPPIRAKQKGVVSLDFDGGKYRDTYELTHSTSGQDAAFGTLITSSEHPRSFWLDGDDTEHITYAEFAAAYYARFPERVAMNQPAMNSEAKHD